MAANPKYADETVNAEADAVARKLDSGYLRIYDGSQPATADTAISGQNLLAELRFNATSAPAASGGVLTFDDFTSDSSANASGTASWARCLKADGTSPVMDGSVGTSSADFVIASTAISAGAAVECTGLTFAVPKG